MELQVENYYQDPGGGGQPNNWICEKNFVSPMYFYQTDLSLEQINNYSDDLWFIHTIFPQSQPETFEVLFERQPSENCNWIFANPVVDALTTHILLATPTIEAQPQNAWSFLINKTWTYGDITTNILLILVLGVFVWDMLRRMFKTRF